MKVEYAPLTNERLYEAILHGTTAWAPQVASDAVSSRRLA